MVKYTFKFLDNKCTLIGRYEVKWSPTQIPLSLCFDVADNLLTFSDFQDEYERWACVCVCVNI